MHHVRCDEEDNVFEWAHDKTEKWVARMRPTWILGDNMSTTFTANNPDTTQRSKHLEVRWFRVRDYIKGELLAVRHIRTADNVADFFTKSLQGAESFDKFRAYLMGDQDFHPDMSLTLLGVLSKQRHGPK